MFTLLPTFEVSDFGSRVFTQATFATLSPIQTLVYGGACVCSPVSCILGYAAFFVCHHVDFILQVSGTPYPVVRQHVFRAVIIRGGAVRVFGKCRQHGRHPTLSC